MVKKYRISKPSKSKLRGNFIVEFAVVGGIFAMALAFCSDSVMMLSTKGKLDRLAYSSVSLLKERTVLFGQDNFSVSASDFQSISQISQRSMARVIKNFDAQKYGIMLQTWSDGDGEVTREDGGIKCVPEQALNTDVSVMTSWDRKAALYKLTMCYETPSWFGNFFGEDRNIVQSSALTIGR